jgi:glycine oxidase
VLIGSTEEPEAGFVKENTAAAVDELLDFALSLVPALAGAAIIKTWSGLRPGSLDGMPSLGRVGDFANLFLAAGHFRAGIQLSPATALVMSDLLLGRAPLIALDEFRPGREPRQPVRTAFHS